MRACRVFWVSLLLPLVAAGCTMWGEKHGSSWSSATGGEQLERLLWQDFQKKNFSDIQKHLAPNFVSVTATGVRDRAATLEHWKSIQLTGYSLGDFQVRSNGVDLVVTYTMSVQGTYQGQPLPETPLHMMTVWQQVSRGWVAISHSASVIAR